MLGVKNTRNVRVTNSFDLKTANICISNSGGEKKYKRKVVELIQCETAGICLSDSGGGKHNKRKVVELIQC